MNKVTALVLTAVLILPAAAVFAQEAKAQKDAPSMMMDKGDKGGMMGKGMMGMMKHGMMMKMMEKSVVATSDGGVVVVMANKMSKYDKDLNLVKEVDLKADMDGMKKMMGEMMEQCSMMDKGVKGKGVDINSDADDKPASTIAAPSSDVDHASHHQ